MKRIHLYSLFLVTNKTVCIGLEETEIYVLTPWFPLNLINGCDDRTYKRQTTALLNHFHSKHIQTFHSGKFPDKILQIPIMNYLSMCLSVST